jgi:hypothetical protein
MVDVALRSYFLTSASKLKLTTPEEVQEAIRGFKVRKASDPNGIPKRDIEQLPQRVVSLLAQIFNAVLLTSHFLTVWKHTRWTSNHKLGKDPALSSFYLPISPLKTMGTLVEKILLAGILH